MYILDFHPLFLENNEMVVVVMSILVEHNIELVFWKVHILQNMNDGQKQNRFEEPQ